MADAISTRTVMIDGLSVVTTDAGAQALEKLTNTIADMKSSMSAAEQKAKDEADAKDAELAAKDAKIADMEKAALSDADLDAKVASRAELIGKAKAIAKDVAVTGLSDAAIRKAAVVAVLGDAAIADKSDAYIDARFDILCEDANKSDPVADALKQTPKQVTDLATTYAARDTALQDAWKPKIVKEA